MGAGVAAPASAVVSRSARGASRVDDWPAEGEARAPAARSPIRYTVQPGDTLLGLARRFDTPVGNIASLNPGIHPDRIKAGEVLVIRPGSHQNFSVVLPPEPEPAAAAVEEDPGGIRIWAPYRSQFDGDPYEGGNCGPASLAMARDSVNWATLTPAER